jgi:two-component system chemotaxis response regulator CheY
VNRKLDQDYSDGLEIIQAIKADPQLAETPVMLITNFPQYQEQAVAAGALPGFGKKELYSETTQKRLADVLK